MKGTATTAAEAQALIGKTVNGQYINDVRVDGNSNGMKVTLISMGTPVMDVSDVDPTALRVE